MHFRFPERKEHRAFQDELLPMFGNGKSVEQTLQGEPHQQHVVIFARFGPTLSQTGMDGCSGIFHARLSK